MKGVNRYGEPDGYDAWLDKKLDEHHRSLNEEPDEEGVMSCLTVRDATHVYCAECCTEAPLDYVPKIGEYPPPCEECESDCTEFVRITEVTEAELGQDDVRDRRRFGGKIERVEEIFCD